MKKTVPVIVLFFITFSLFISGWVMLFLSIKNILATQTIQKTQSSQHAIVVDVVELGRRGYETAVYFIVKNDNIIHRARVVIGFTNNTTPRVRQIIHVRGDESRKLWIIEEYVIETYITYISWLVLSIVLLVCGVLSLKGTKELL